MPDRRELWVTAYTDASFRLGVGGWSIWLRSNEGRIVRSGTAPTGLAVCSFTAELYAIRIAIETAVREWPGTTGIQVNTDCQSAIGPIYPWGTKLGGVARIHQKAIHRVLSLHNIRVRGKHVKGHTNGRDVRSYLNRQVDLGAGQMTGRYNGDKEKRWHGNRPSTGSPSSSERDDRDGEERSG